LDDENIESEEFNEEFDDTDERIENIENGGTISISVMEKALIQHVTTSLTKAAEKIQKIIQIAKQNSKDLSSPKTLLLFNDIFEEIKSIRLNQNIINTILNDIFEINKTIIDIEMTTIQKTIYRALYEKNKALLTRDLATNNFVTSLNNLEI
jgi:hypothetical protein